VGRTPAASRSCKAAMAMISSAPCPAISKFMAAPDKIVCSRARAMTTSTAVPATIRRTTHRISIRSSERFYASMSTNLNPERSTRRRPAIRLSEDLDGTKSSPWASAIHGVSASTGGTATSTSPTWGRTSGRKWTSPRRRRVAAAGSTMAGTRWRDHRATTLRRAARPGSRCR